MRKKTYFGILLALFGFISSADAAPSGNIWHIPFNQESGIPGRMRDPYVEINPNGSFFVYQGFFKNSGANGNQTGGSLHFRNRTTGGAWQSVALSFYTNSGLSQFWRASIVPGAGGMNAGPNDVIEYYFLVTFDGVSGSNPENTYIYGGDLDPGVGNQQKSTGEAAARANPYSFRNRPAWIFHSDNRVVNGNDVQFWAQVGYVGDVNNPSTRWANMGAVYFTTNGTEPMGTRGVANNGSTQVAPFVYDHPEQNNIENGSITGGRGMWWVANTSNLLSGLPLGTTIKYKVGFWHTDNNEEKFGDHNAGTGNRTFSFTNGAIGDPVLTVSSASTGTLNGNYTTTKLYVDEIAADSIPITVVFSPGQPSVSEVECVTNLNQRHRADADKNANNISDGQEWNQTSGIIGPSSDDSFYYQSRAMTPTSTPGEYSVVLNATRTGAYRLTTRWKVSGDPNWRQYTASGRRDHAITVAPTDARNICLYEINTLTIEANGGGFSNRSTFEDLHDAAGALRTGDGKNFNLAYLQALGVNWLWFQPVHPPAIVGREVDPATGAPYDHGSPYAIKNFFEIDPAMSVANTRPAARTAFKNFVAAADAANVEIMLDAPFNHTGFDVELGQPGIDLFQPDGSSWSITDEIRNRDARFFSRGDIFNSSANDYCARAFNAGSMTNAPDRGDFGKWGDVVDVYFGRYDALVCNNPGDNSNYLNEGDQFYYTNTLVDANWTANDFVKGGINRNVTKNVWKYFKEYALYWLDQTGYTAGTPHTAANRNKGIDGLRCDFGQGLPPQAWEYIINCARTRKWNFVMMSESLDGGAVTYRSNRHFDILNENIVFPLQSASSASDYRQIFESRRSAYGQGLVLINNTSHDEESYVDPFQALIRYAVAGTMDGVPLIFMGQELGISRTFGFNFYETNFGKQIGHFKKYNSLNPIWADTDFGNDQLYPVYAGINAARKFSLALRSNNRFFMNGDGSNSKIHAVAKYATPGVSPAFGDAVLAFANLDRNNNQSDNYHFSGFLKSQLGLKNSRTYNVKNIAAYLGQTAGRRDVYLWPDDDSDATNGVGLKGSTLDTGSGAFVSLNKVPTTIGAWTTAPYEPLYLKVFDVTPPPSPAPMPPKHYIIGTAGTFTWTNPAGPDDNITKYIINIGTTPGGNNVVNGVEVASGINTINFTGTFGTTYYATLKSVSAAGVTSSVASSSDPGNPNPGSATTPVILLDPDGDNDGDGMKNSAEDEAKTDPLNSTSTFRVKSVAQVGTTVTVRWDSVSGVNYVLQGRSSLTSGTWDDIPGTLTAGTGGEVSANDTVSVTDPRKFYRVRTSP